MRFRRMGSVTHATDSGRVDHVFIGVAQVLWTWGHDCSTCVNVLSEWYPFHVGNRSPRFENLGHPTSLHPTCIAKRVTHPAACYLILQGC